MGPIYPGAGYYLKLAKEKTAQPALRCPNCQNDVTEPLDACVLEALLVALADRLPERYTLSDIMAWAASDPSIATDLWNGRLGEALNDLEEWWNETHEDEDEDEGETVSPSGEEGIN